MQKSRLSDSNISPQVTDDRVYYILLITSQHIPSTNVMFPTLAVWRIPHPDDQYRAANCFASGEYSCMYILRETPLSSTMKLSQKDGLDFEYSSVIKIRRREIYFIYDRECHSGTLSRVSEFVLSDGLAVPERLDFFIAL